MDDRSQSINDEFKRWLANLDIALSDFQLTQFNEYATLLVEWNKTRNLTSITEIHEIYSKHFYDSVALLQIMREHLPVTSVLDLGTGAGFPGIPLKILMPEWKLTLCDSLRKRVEFLNVMVSELGLNDVTVVHARAEELAIERVHRESYSHLVSRAVASMPTLLEWAFPFLMVKGHFYAMKGPNATNEWELSSNAAQVLGAALVRDFSYNLPLNMGERMVLDIQKVKPTSRRFPRKPGEASRKPL